MPETNWLDVGYGNTTLQEHHETLWSIGNKVGGHVSSPRACAACRRYEGNLTALRCAAHYEPQLPHKGLPALAPSCVPPARAPQFIMCSFDVHQDAPLLGMNIANTAAWNYIVLNGAL